ncbi:MAG: hypothetical protein WKG00_13525 [Polyangiaceae bacterium]
MKGYALLVATIALNATGQLLLKRATMGSAVAGLGRGVLLSPWFVFGALAHAATMIVWLLTLRELPLTVAHPITGSVFILVPLVAHFLWSEPLGAQRVIGIAIIALGIAVVANVAS